MMEKMLEVVFRYWKRLGSKQHRNSSVFQHLWAENRDKNILKMSVGDF